MFGIFKKTPETIAREAEETAAHEPVALLRHRHESLLSRAALAGQDISTWLLLIQLFGPLAVALLTRLLDRISPPQV